MHLEIRECPVIITSVSMMNKEDTSKLLLVAALGSGLQALAATAMLAHASVAAGIACTVGDILILIGILGFRRSGKVAWRWSATGLTLSVLSAILVLWLPTLIAGPIQNFSGRLNWLADAIAYGLVGWAVVRTSTQRRAVATAVGCGLRAIAALYLAGRPSPTELSLGPEHAWEILVVVSASLLVFFFASRSSTERQDKVGHEGDFV